MSIPRSNQGLVGPVILFLVTCSSIIALSEGGSSTRYHRTTSLDDLKLIDSYVATGLPLFDHGFFVNTASGPILVKAKEEGPNKQNKPKINPGYYSTLPRLIPTGYQGISISHFNLGTAIPAQAPTYYSHQFHPVPINHHHHVPSSNTHPDVSVSNNNNNNNEPSYSHSQYFHDQNYEYASRRQDDFGFPHHQEPSFQTNNFLTAEEESFALFGNRLGLGQDQGSHQSSHVPTSFQNTVVSHEPSTPFHVGRGGRQEDQIRHDHGHDTAHERSRPRLPRNPIVEQALSVDEELPEHLKNPFYKNEALASALAQESLPVEGEQIVGEWETDKIQKRRIQDLLRGSGLIL